MSGKYNRKHPQRGRSRYPERLEKRGVTGVTVRMEDLKTLRRRQGVSVQDPEIFATFMRQGMQ
jgi:hypothetical protein